MQCKVIHPSLSAVQHVCSETIRALQVIVVIQGKIQIASAAHVLTSQGKLQTASAAHVLTSKCHFRYVTPDEVVGTPLEGVGSCPNMQDQYCLGNFGINLI